MIIRFGPCIVCHQSLPPAQQGDMRPEIAPFTVGFYQGRAGQFCKPCADRIDPPIFEDPAVDAAMREYFPGLGRFVP